MFLRKLALRTGLTGWFITAFVMTTVPQANAAPLVIFSSLGSVGCVSNYSGSPINTMKFRATSTFTANVVRVSIGTQSAPTFANSTFYIMSHSTSGGTAGQGSPGTPLAVFTPDAITGTGAYTVANFTGNVTITSGTYFWMSFGNRQSVLPYCFKNGYTSATELTMNGAVVDTSTSGTNASWLRAQSTVDTSPVNATWSVRVNSSLAYQFSLESTVLPQVSISLSGPQVATYKSPTTLTATVDNQSRITFYANGKGISGCKNVLSSGGTATCSWKPAMHGGNSVYASANPVSNSYASNTSSILNVGIATRTNKR